MPPPTGHKCVLSGIWNTRSQVHDCTGTQPGGQQARGTLDAMRAGILFPHMAQLCLNIYFSYKNLLAFFKFLNEQVRNSTFKSIFLGWFKLTLTIGSTQPL